MIGIKNGKEAILDRDDADGVQETHRKQTVNQRLNPDLSQEENSLDSWSSYHCDCSAHWYAKSRASESEMVRY